MVHGAIYVRISLDAEGEALGVGRQEEDCRALAAAKGITVADDAVFVENDTGASTRSRKKVRPVYDEMLRRAGTGEFAVIIAYSNSRLTRRPLELESLISLHERTGVKYETVVSGMDDLSTADGRMVARIKASVDASEVERTAERVARTHLANARTGRPVGGTRPFGWEYDKTTVIEAEADMVRAAAEKLIAGESLKAITRAWNESGVLTSRGNQWTPRTVRQILRSPRYAGWRVHQGEIALDTQGQPVRGLWEPILDQETFDRLQLVFDRPDPRTRKPRRDGRHYLLTGIIRCGICNAPLYGNAHTGGKFYYVCTNTIADMPHGLAASGLAIDKLVGRHVLGLIDTRAEADEVTAPPVFDGQARLDEIDVEIRGLMAQLREGGSAGAIYRQVAELEDEKAETTKGRTRWLAESAVSPALAVVSNEDWESMSVDLRRAQVEAVLEAVVVSPATRRGNSFDPNRLTFVPRQPAALG